MAADCEVSLNNPLSLRSRWFRRQPECAQTLVDSGCEFFPHVPSTLRLQLGVEVDERQ